MSYGQNDSTGVESPSVNISGFMDVFYAFDFNRPDHQVRQSFFYNHNRHNEFNLNLGYIKLGITHRLYRANFGIQTGTYIQDNYAQEPALLKNIQEANIGLALNHAGNMWFDVGIFSSHIGFESAVSMDNLTLTRTILAENSPYFLAGAKWTYQPNKQWTFLALVINGWQRIQRLESNNLLSLGTQITYTPHERFLINWSTFAGTDDPDVQRRMRYFNNWYCQVNIRPKLDMMAGFDFGMQQKVKGSELYHHWYSPVIILKYNWSNKFKTSFRAEYYQDRSGVIIDANAPHGFAAKSISSNFDFFPMENIALRVEGRWLGSKDNLFVYKDGLKNNNFFLTASLAIKFAHNL